MTSLHYVAFPSLHEPPLTIPARLRIPDAPGKLPAVIILHGSAGPSEREGGYAEPLNAAGFVTLEPDQWSPRGLGGGAYGRPRTIHETLPDLYGARAFLAGHPRVDASRIGVMGFSFGAVASMLAATRARNQPFLGEAHFAALMPVYPVCHLYNRAPTFEFGDLVLARRRRPGQDPRRGHGRRPPRLRHAWPGPPRRGPRRQPRQGRNGDHGLQRRSRGAGACPGGGVLQRRDAGPVGAGQLRAERQRGPTASDRTRTLNTAFDGLPDAMDPALSRQNQARSPARTDRRTPSGAWS